MSLCAKCGGSGEVPLLPNGASDAGVEKPLKCPDCDGRGRIVRNLPCLLPDGAIVIEYYDIHPCDDKLYLREAWCYGPEGRIGYYLPNERH